jgi:hypothetical protein
LIRSYVERNDTSRAELRRLVERLTDAACQRELGEGWNVTALLGHLAFWDRYVLAVLETWQRTGAAPRTGEANEINLAALPGWRGLPPSIARTEALAAADALDAHLAGLPEPFAEAIVAAGRHRYLDRSLHRRDHMAALE